MKPSNLLRAALLFTVLVALLPGCTSPPTGRATNTHTGDQAGKREEFVGDRELIAKFVMLGIKTEPRDGRLRVQFDLKNTTSGDLSIEWAIEWKDGNGSSLDTHPQWRPTLVTGQGSESIQVISPMPEAGGFQLHMRKPTQAR